MKNLLKTILAGFIVTSNFAFADPPRASHNHWRNTNYAGHYVLYDYASRTYIETINCRPAYRFSVVSNEINVLTLYDASRNMTVRLDYSGMYLKESGAVNFTFYQNGTFDTRTQFQHNVNGAYTGALTKGHGCSWVEYLAGSSQPNFRFVEKSTNAQSVELYDGSRNMYVRLDANTMWLRTGSNPYGFFKNGRW